jgi:hypothetical protein
MKNKDLLVNYILFSFIIHIFFRLAFVFAFFYVCIGNIAH